MTLTETQLWSLVLVVPALVSGVVSSTVAWFLARWKGLRVFRSFGRLTLLLTLFGLVDGSLSWLKPDLGSSWFLGLGFVDAFLMGLVVLGLADFTAALTSRPWGPVARVLFALPLVAALVVVPGILATPGQWSFSVMLLVGRGFLSAVFVAALACGARIVLGWGRVHDRIFRRILVGTGLLLVAFVPLWFWDVFGQAGALSFYIFFLIWNLGALGLASRAFFEPGAPPPTGTLFAPGSLAACSHRFGLTPREAEVAGLHAQGFSAKEIGATLFIAPKTVRNHISNLYQKTGTGQRRELLELLRSVPGHREVVER